MYSVTIDLNEIIKVCFKCPFRHIYLITLNRTGEQPFFLECSIWHRVMNLFYTGGIQDFWLPMIHLAGAVKSWRYATCPITSPLGSAHLHSTLGPEPREQQLPVETQKTERRQLRRRQRRDKQRVCVIYLQSLGCWTGCCCCNILNLTGKAWWWSDSSCWCTVARRDRSYTHTHTHRKSFLSCCSAHKSQRHFRISGSFGKETSYGNRQKEEPLCLFHLAEQYEKNKTCNCLGRTVPGIWKQTVHEWGYSLSCAFAVGVVAAWTDCVDKKFEVQVDICTPRPSRTLKGNLHNTYSCRHTYAKSMNWQRGPGLWQALPKQNVECGSTFSAKQHINASLQLDFMDSTSLSHWYIEQHIPINSGQTEGKTPNVINVRSVFYLRLKVKNPILDYLKSINATWLCHYIKWNILFASSHFHQPRILEVWSCCDLHTRLVVFKIFLNLLSVC